MVFHTLYYEYYWSKTCNTRVRQSHPLDVSFSLAISLANIFSLRSSSSFVPLLPHVPVTSILASTFRSRTCLRRQFLRKMWQIHLAFLLFNCFVAYFCPPWPFLIHLHFSHNRFNFFFSSTTFQNFSGVSDLLSEVSAFKHRTELCSKYSTLLVCVWNAGGRITEMGTFMIWGNRASGLLRIS